MQNSLMADTKIKIELWSPTIIILSSLILNIGGRLCSVIISFLDKTPRYLVSDELSYWQTVIFGLLITLTIIQSLVAHNKEKSNVCIKAALFGSIFSIAGAFYSDIIFLFQVVKNSSGYLVFSFKIQSYLAQEAWLYIYLLLISIFLLAMGWWKNIFSTQIPMSIPKAIIVVLMIALLTVYPLPLMNLYLLNTYPSAEFVDLPLGLMLLLNFVYCLVSIALPLIMYIKKDKLKMSITQLIKIINGVGIGAIFTFIFEILMAIIPYKVIANHGFISSWGILANAGYDLKTNIAKFIPILILLLFSGLFREYINKKQFECMAESEQTSGNFGTASWATKTDIEKLKAYDSTIGPPIGADEKGNMLYLPLCNKLTISPPGGGKTTTSSIPVLLSHNGPAFVFDIKGELWAVTARYRSEVLGRQVIVIDPFDITKGKDFANGKPDSLLKKYCLNPFDWIPEDQKHRDRIMNAFAASFIINEGGFSTHFDENSKILIRGYIDYMMSLDVSSRGLPMLYHLMSEKIEEAQLTFEEMAKLNGRAGAAANQIMRVGSDERGSILSTSYRQIDWMGDSNIQETLSKSNFDLRDFLKGNMDIFVVLPEDQIKEHSRLVRMLMSLLMGIIVQANPSELPEKKMLFLLEELAQLGYCPDVEQSIEVLRARGVVVWTVFQTLSQIEAFEKPDLFKGATLKQIFTNDDTKTMEWIQTLGGKKTVLTKTLSTNKGDSRQKMQVFGGSVSSGEGESIHETGADLIQLNEIREMPKNEQFVFLHEAKPIRCKKVRYFENPHFSTKYDTNPLEK